MLVIKNEHNCIRTAWFAYNYHNLEFKFTVVWISNDDCWLHLMPKIICFRCPIDCWIAATLWQLSTELKRHRTDRQCGVRHTMVIVYLWYNDMWVSVVGIYNGSIRITLCKKTKPKYPKRDPNWKPRDGRSCGNRANESKIQCARKVDDCVRLTVD